MNREEYLKQLKNNILSLSTDEQSEALQYYSDYFEDANDDEKVIAELGTPEELAKTIIEKFANALVDAKSSVKEEENTQSNDNFKSEDALYYEFSPSKVNSLYLNIGAADVVIISSKKFTIETRGIQKDAMNCFLSSDGNLTVSNSRRININFWSHDRKLRIVPRMLIGIPDSVVLKKVNISVGAGNFRTKDALINFEAANISVGAGNLVLKKAIGGSVNLRCGMGNLEYFGLIKGKSNVDCGMGNVKIILDASPDEYSYDAKVGLGDLKFHNEKKSGVCQILNNERKQNHVSINCGMGNVCVKFEK